MNTRQGGEIIARSFYGTYHELAPEHGVRTGVDPATLWLAVDERERKLLAAAFKKMLESGVIRAAAPRYGQADQPFELEPIPAQPTQRGWSG